MAEPEPMYGIEGPLRNMRSEPLVELKTVNKAYNECFTKSFLPRWLKGEEGIQVSEVCGSQYEELMEKHGEVYAESPIPFRTF